jgi:hypothetical protein
MIDHKISVQTFNRRMESQSFLLRPKVLTLHHLCKTNLAEIFQESGDYCLHCWQEITYPNV